MSRTINRAPVPGHVRAAALADLRRGGTLRTIAAIHGVSPSALGKWARAANFPSRKPGPKPKPKPVDDIAFTGQWVRDGLIWRQEVAS